MCQLDLNCVCLASIMDEDEFVINDAYVRCCREEENVYDSVLQVGSNPPTIS